MRRKLWVLVAAVVLTGAGAMALTDEFVLTSTNKYSKTTGPTTVAVTATTPLRLSTPATGGMRVFVNATSSTSGFYVPANTIANFQPSGNVTQLVFIMASSAAATPNWFSVAR